MRKLRCALRLSVLLAAVVFTVASAGLHAALTTTNLLCEGLVEPLGIDADKPRFSWRLKTAERGENQIAYQILAATTAELLARDQADLWNTGKVNSSETLNISYMGRPLATSQQVFWKVRVWSRDIQPSPWSSVATFTMGVLDTPRGPAWQSGVKWITDPELLKWERKGYGFCSRPTRSEDTTKWVQLDLGASQKIDTVVLRAIQHTLQERYGFPQRFKIEASDDATFKNTAATSTIFDQTAADFNEWKSEVSRSTDEKTPVVARYVRVTATKLRKADDGRICFALSQIEVLSGGKNIAVNAGVTASDVSEDTEHWPVSAVVDGLGTSAHNPRANSTLLLRREFTVREGLVRALVHITGLGQYEFFANGSRVGTGVLTPGWTTYSKGCLYDTYDITQKLREGGNALGMVLAGGMYNVQAGPENRYRKFTSVFRPLVAYGQIRLEYSDGLVDTIGTDETWQVTPGPVTYSNVYGGEDYDARLEPIGWNQPGYDDSSWTKAAPSSGPGGKLRGVTRASPPFAHFEHLQPAAINKIRDGVSVYDFGQNASMMPALSVRGPAGAVVRMTPAELVHPDGTVDRGSCGGGVAYWQYTLNGNPLGESWTPDFFYHGSRYVQVELIAPEGSSQLPVIEKLESLVTHSDSPPAGSFSCSNELFNRIHMLIRWAQRSNLAHVISDCPHRERLGWLEQYHLNGPSLRYEWNLDRLFVKCFDDMADSQTPDGLVTSISPEYVVFSGGFRDSPEWGSAFIIAAWQHYIWTGDDMPLRRHYRAMDVYLDYLNDRADRGILSHGLGDWYDLGPDRPGYAQLTPIALTATATYYEATRTLSKIAALVGQEEESKQLGKEADKIADAFNKNFLNKSAPKTRGKAGSGAGVSGGMRETIYADGSQTAQAMPLVLGLVPTSRRSMALAALVADIRTHGNSVTAGDVGYHYVLRALADGGRSDVVYEMNNQSEKPGYGYQLAQGATSLTEAWNADPRSSQNHFMLGHIMEWFYHDLAGLQPDPTGPGFKKIIINPSVIDGINWASATHEAPRGEIRCSWKREPGKFELEITIPPGSIATVHVPAKRPSTVKEGGEFAARSKGVRALRGGALGNEAIFEVDSGHYVFTAEY